MTMLPLRDRAAALYAAAKERTQAEQQRWQQSEKPVLKQYARGLKETLGLQHQALAAQQAKVDSLAAAGGGDAGVHTGFNVIRARVTSDGRPFPTEELKAERERLARALNQLAIDVAAAKAEIQGQRRKEEVDIWETQLVALQDTMRVYKSEINMIEVELLGREQQERIEADRRAAEASGQAQLQRLQEQATQTRVRHNRAKQQYHFPPPYGYNITFGGGGIYGACKDITICEIHGNASITAEVVAGGSSGSSTAGGGSSAAGANTAGGAAAGTTSSEPRARLIIQFGAPNSVLGNLGAASGGGSRSGATQPANISPTPGMGHRRESSFARPAGAAAAAANGFGPGLSPSPPKPNAGSSSRAGNASGASPPRQPSSLRQAPTSKGAPAPAAGPAATASSSSEQPAAAAAAPPPPAAAAAGAEPPPPVARKPSRAKAMAVRFLNKIGAKKDKYQGKEQPQLQPSVADTSNKRTLASKLLHRKSASRVGEPPSPRDGVHLDSGLPYGDTLEEEEEEEEESAGRSELAGSSQQGQQGSRHGHLLASSSQSLQSAGAGSQGRDYSDCGEAPLSPPLTREALAAAEAEAAREDDDDGSSTSSSSSSTSSEDSDVQLARAAAAAAAARLGGASVMGSERGSWLRGRGGSSVGREGGGGTSTWGGTSSVGASSDVGVEPSELSAAAMASAAPSPAGAAGRRGVHVVGRVTGFGLLGERGSKVPNLSLAQGDVEGQVFVRFVFEYTKLGGWQPAEKPVFDVTHLHTRLKGNNVPMPDALIKTILRLAIPGLIQRKLLAVVPRELGSYLLEAAQGFHVNADVALVGAPLSVLDADLSFEVKGPAKSAPEAKKQQQKYAAAKEARRLLGLTLPQAQVLAELFGSKGSGSSSGCVLEMSHPVSIFQLVQLQRTFDKQPALYAELCQVLNTGYQLLAGRSRTDPGDFDFRQLMDGPVSRMRRKPARIRVILHRVDLPLNLDSLLTAVRDYFQRALEELLIRGPVPNPRDNPEMYEDEPHLEEQVELLHAWHAWMLQELSHFKSKFQGAGGTLLGAACSRGFSAGVENAYYEGPLRVRVPVNMQLDADGAFSFDVPLPSPEGALGEFMDGIKGRLVPCHLRPPSLAINWIPPTGDTEIDASMQQQVEQALALVSSVLGTLSAKVEARGAAQMDEDPSTALTQPRTLLGDRLGRFIVNRLRVHVRLDERRISEILAGIDSRSMGSGFVATAGRILGHLGDVMTLGFTPAAATSGLGNLTTAPTGQSGPPQQYLFVFESSDISRLRADVQSLGFQSLITPGGAVRLVHAVARSFLSAFKNASPALLQALDERLITWYQHMTRESLDVSLCLDVKGSVSGGSCCVMLSGTADEAQLRETSPLVAVNDLELLPAAVAMFGSPVGVGGGGPAAGAGAAGGSGSSSK